MINAFTTGYKESSPQAMAIPRSKSSSNSVHCPFNLPQNSDNIFTMGASCPFGKPTSADKPPVILLDKYLKELAKGYVVTDASAGF